MENYPEAFDELNEILEIYPEDTNTNKKLIELYIKVQNYESAIETCESLLSMNENNSLSLWILNNLVNLYYLNKDIDKTMEYAKKLIEQGKEVSVILGFNSENEVFYENEFKALGCNVTVTTVDGSYGVKGFVTNAYPNDYTYFYTCGPEPMLKSVYKTAVTSGQMSFEERMGCGFGACMGCSCKTIAGYKRICKDGPVMKKEEILWED